MSTMDELAARLYPAGEPTTGQADAAAVTSAPSPEENGGARSGEALAEALYKGTAPLPEPDAPGDAEMKALREDPASRLYGHTAAERALPQDLFDAVISQSVEIDGQMVEIDQATARKTVSELRAMAGDLELSADEIGAMSDSLTFARSIQGDEQKVIAARETAVELLNAEHGQNAALAARAARAYVAKNPKLSALLERTGAGDAPQAVVLIARRALSLHRAGKLTVPAIAPATAGPGPATAAQRLYPGMKP